MIALVLLALVIATLVWMSLRPAGGEAVQPVQATQVSSVVSLPSQLDAGSV